MSGRRILVTGGGGFVGVAVGRALAARGDRVLAVVRPGRIAARVGALPDAVEVTPCDLHGADGALEALLERWEPDVVVHAAVRSAYAPRDVAATAADNVAATTRLLHALARARRRPRLVALGSSLEYGRAPGPVAESAPLAPVTLRGESKALASRLVLAHHRAGRVEAGVLRPFTVYGPWESEQRLVPNAIRAALSGDELPLAPIAAVHDYVFVDDVARACLLAADSPRFPGSAWNLCSGRATRNDELLDRVEAATGRAIRRRHDVLPARESDRGDWFGDPRRAASELGWSAAVALDEGLAATVEFWRTRPAGRTDGEAVPA